MGYFGILDTGFIKTSNEGTQASSGNRANGGNVISLKTADFKPTIKRNIQDNPDIGTNQPSEVDLGTLENMKFVLTCKLDKDNTVDMLSVEYLLDLVVTNGYKLLWYNWDDAIAEKPTKLLIKNIARNNLFGGTLTTAEKNLYGLAFNYDVLKVHITSSQYVETGSSNRITYQITGIVLKREESVL
ncbi:unnamed protein product [marine sediment metagenome]|uniref:Uncharacterized protein n=1 Tax=marine sediment metagenome TaxID=412755 RepID=X0U7R9_9ZZZZ